MKIKVIETELVIEINKKITLPLGQNHVCAQPEKIESALHAAIYPGNFPFVHGGTVDIAAALFFYIIKTHAFFDGNKRTALITTIVFLESNGWTLKYPVSPKNNEIATLADECAASKKNLEQVKKWFQLHKVKI